MVCALARTQQPGNGIRNLRPLCLPVFSRGAVTPRLEILNHALLYYPSAEHRDLGAIDKKRRVRRTSNHFTQFRSVESSRIALKARVPGWSDVPWRVGDVILHRAAAPASAVTPVMLGNELFQAAIRYGLRNGGRPAVEAAPCAGESKFVRNRHAVPVGAYRMAHRKPDVVFAVNFPGKLCDGAAGHNLGHKNNSSPFFVSFFPSNVEAQVHFFEIGMKRDREATQQSRVAKPEAYQAHVDPAAEGIEHRTRRDAAMQQAAVHLIVQHHQIAPLGGKEDSRHVRIEYMRLTKVPD